MPSTLHQPGSGAHDVVPRRRPLRRALHALAVTLVVVLVVGTVGAAFVWYKLESNITEDDVSDLLGSDRPQKIEQEGAQQPKNILLIGSDSREGPNRRYDNKTVGARSDTTILLHLAADRKSAVAVSIPRDTMVEIPQCPRDDGSMTSAGIARFNDAYTRGGAACTIRTVETMTRIRMDHYVVVDFTGFVKMVNALGGVEICLPERVDDNDSKLHLDEGRHLVKGRTALAYVRTRKALGNGSDIERIDRQQAFLSSVVNRVKSTGVLLRPDRLLRFLDAATKSITTDSELASLNDLRRLAQSVRGIEPGNINFVTAPNKPNPSNPNTVVLKQPAADRLWSVLRYDTPLPGQNKTPGAASSPSPTGTPLRTPPEDIRVRVLNGAGTAGAAGSLSERLKVAGFNVTGVDNATSSDYVRTQIRHSPAYDESARTLSAALPGAEVIPDPALAGSATLTVIVGADRPRVATIQVEGSTASPAEPTIAARKATQDICS